MAIVVSPKKFIIAGATTPEQVELNARAVNWQLTPDGLPAVDKATQRGSS